MGDTPINLNRARKDKARAVKRAQADENAVKFGRSGVVKSLDRARRDKTAGDLDGHKRDR